nr:MAG TPA: hypothetical protein [Caudoviricetes sp.]
MGTKKRLNQMVKPSFYLISFSSIQFLLIIIISYTL